MSAPQIQWKGPAVPRAKPVPTELWEKHKEELCDLYQKMKLDDLMVLMRVRHHFTPSRRQYISQMEKWGVGKYNKSNSGASKPEARMIYNLPSLSHREHEQNETKGSEQRPRDLPPLKRNAPDGRPNVPPKKRQKLAKFLSEKAYEDLAIAFDKLPSLEEGCQNMVSMSEKEFDASQDIRAGYKQNSNVPTTQNMSAPAIHTHEDEDDADDLLSGSDKSEIDQANISSDINLANFNDFKIAADFLAVLNFYSEAFEIYLLLFQNLELLDEDSERREKMTIAVVIGCGRYATTPSQIAIAVKILSQRLSYRPIYSDDTPKTFVYRCLARDLYTKQGNMAEADFQERLIARSSFVQDRNLSAPMLDTPALSIQLFIHINRVLSRGRLINMKNIEKELIFLRPRPFEYGVGQIYRNLIRSCLEQFSIYCRRRSCFTHEAWIEYINDEPTDFKNYRFFNLFYELWRFSKFQTAFFSEADRIGMDTGISSTEFLATVCNMIIAATPPISMAEIKFLLGPVGSVATNTMFLRMVDGVESLLRRSDQDIVNAFLKAYSETNECIRVTRPNNRIYQSIKSMLEKKLWINIPDTLNVDQHYQDDDEKSAIHLTGAFETLCPSLHSATFSSLRALKDHLEKNIEQSTESFNLPSTMMKEGSMTSMLLPFSPQTGSLNSLVSLPGGDVATSALDTLATVSSCIKDSIAEIEYRAAGMHQISDL